MIQYDIILYTYIDYIIYRSYRSHKVNVCCFNSPILGDGKDCKRLQTTRLGTVYRSYSSRMIYRVEMKIPVAAASNLHFLQGRSSCFRLQHASKPIFCWLKHVKPCSLVLIGTPLLLMKSPCCSHPNWISGPPHAAVILIATFLEIQQNWGCKQRALHQQILVDVCNIIHIGHIFVNSGFPDKHGNQPVQTKKCSPCFNGQCGRSLTSDLG